MCYGGGEIALHKAVDPDLLSFFEIEGILREYGYESGDLIYWCLCGVSFDEGASLVTSDKDVMEMIEQNGGDGLVHLYVVSSKPTQIGPCTPACPAQEALPEGYVGDASDEGGTSSGDGDHSESLQSSDDAYDSDLDKETEEDKQFWEELISSDDDLFDVDFVDKNDLLQDEAQMTEDLGEEEQHSDYGPSDELISPNDSVNEEGRKRDNHEVFNEDRDMSNVRLINGMKFSSAAIFRKAVRELNVRLGKDVKFVKNDGDRVVVECAKKCGWRVYGRLVKDEGYFQIKSYNHIHKCSRSYRNSSVTAAYLCEKYLEKLRMNPSWPTDAMHQEVKRDLKVDVSVYIIYRAKRAAFDRIYGEYKEQYARIWDYCHTLIKWNHGSRIKLKVDRPISSAPAIFQRMFVSFEAMTKGFKEGCRPLIGLDGCHLKGPCGGQLLSAIGRDPNDNIYPIAFAAVEIENKDSWVWFLDNLLEALGTGEGWTFISDRQKGLVNALELVMPKAEIRYCVRHLYANFKDSGHKGQAMKGVLWAAASAYIKKDWESALTELEKIDMTKDKKAYHYLKDIDASTWSRAFMTGSAKSDLIVNNLSESFNSYIMEARNKPLVTMMEIIRRKLMRRFHLKREGAKKWEQKYCPRILKKLEREAAATFECVTDYAGESWFEVQCKGQTFVVNLKEKTCGCRKWDMTGIPCVHAISAIVFDGGNPEEFLDECYTTDAYRRAYAGVIYPMPGRDQWEKTEYEDVEPPIWRRGPGRPKVLRTRAVDEPKNTRRMRKTGIHMRCGKCRRAGHNARRCPNVPPKETQPLTEATQASVEVGQGSSNPKARRHQSQGKKRALEGVKLKEGQGRRKGGPGPIQKGPTPTMVQNPTTAPAQLTAAIEAALKALADVQRRTKD